MEIERKFLVKNKPNLFFAKEKINIFQFYLSFNPEIRLRKSNETFFLTIKSGEGLVRSEFEFIVSEEEYIARKKDKISNEIRKTRYILELTNDCIAEFDVYNGYLKGLCVVEVEFKTEGEALGFVPPQWFGDEITSNKKYKNKNLSKINSVKEIY
jgi:CYTH domain-containing protein